MPLIEMEPKSMKNKTEFIKFSKNTYNRLRLKERKG